MIAKRDLNHRVSALTGAPVDLNKEPYSLSYRFGTLFEEASDRRRNAPPR